MAVAAEKTKDTTPPSRPAATFGNVMAASLPLVVASIAVMGVMALTGQVDPLAAAVAAVLLILAAIVMARPLVQNLAMSRAYGATLERRDIVDPPRLRPAPGADDLQQLLRQIHALLAARDGQIDELRAEAGRILDALPDPILMVARDGHVARTNKAGRALFGNDVVGRDLAAVTRDPGLLEAVQHACDKGESSSIEVAVMVARVARTYGANVAPLPVRGNGGPAVMVVLHDLTAIKRTEQMRVDFVANASHEIRSPLATLVGCIETLRGPARDDREAWDGFLEMMDDQGRRMTRLVGDLLSLSRIELNEHTQPTGAIELATILALTQTALEWEATAKDMVIRLKLDDNLPPARGDASEIEQVAYNLLNNAIKYGRAGTEITVTAGTRKLPPERARMDRVPVVWFAVRNRGDGIAAEHLPRLTERFYRVDTARSRELGGTGLGLAIVKHVLNRHRGDMTIDSAEGEGSTFAVYLPVADTAEEEAAA